LVFPFSFFLPSSLFPPTTRSFGVEVYSFYPIISSSSSRSSLLSSSYYLISLGSYNPFLNSLSLFFTLPVKTSPQVKIYMPYVLLHKRSDDVTGSGSTGAASLPIAFVVGAVCAVALVAGLFSYYVYRRRSLASSSPFSLHPSTPTINMPGSTFSGNEKLITVGKSSPTVPQPSFLSNRASISIWQSVDLGRVGLGPVASITALPLEGYEAAQGGYDPDAQQMTSFSVRYSEEGNETKSQHGDDAETGEEREEKEKGDVEEMMEAEEDVIPPGVEFYHQTPETAYVPKDCTSAPSPLYHEFPAGEQW